MEAIKRFGQLS